MKRFFCLLLTVIILIPLAACSPNNNNSDNDEVSADYMTTSCSKDSVDEFMSIIGEVELGDLSTGMKLDEEHCYNVTPLSVARPPKILCKNEKILPDRRNSRREEI